MKKIKSKIKKLLAGLVFILVINPLPLPAIENKMTIPNEQPFLWNQDEFWNQLEQEYQVARKLDKADIILEYKKLKTNVDAILLILKTSIIDVTSSELDSLENYFFRLGPLAAVQSNLQDDYISLYSEIRELIKQQSQHWDMNNHEARNTIYSLLYGLRAAVEEVLLQSKDNDFPAVLTLNESKFKLPEVDLLGMKIQSGDVLMSRGGAEVSALISRGNDYPGNFSHVALAYIDENNVLHFIESHIEIGVAIANKTQYLNDKKLRLMVMRLRSDLPEIIADSLLPHKAAKYSYESSMSRHIPYDFAMDYYDTTKLFCSEVASLAYSKFNIKLWEPVSTISSPGVVKWLNDFGVENFVTTMPSDLEYDPKLDIIAEWRNPETLLKDHIDNAVIDVMFEMANEGHELEYNCFLLPVVGVLKFWCYMNNLFGVHCIIPEGMGPVQALKNEYFEDLHQKIKHKTEILIEEFKSKNGYNPPYWQIVKLAEQAQKEVVE